MVRLEHVTKIYNVQDSNAYRALNDISLCIEDGEMIAIIGKSGAGKSTLLHILACIDTYNEGEYYLDDELIRAMSGNQMARIRNEQIGLVMQDYALVEDYSVLDNVLLPLDFSTRKKRGKKQLAIDALESVSMGEYASKRAAKLSGGQKQRLTIARALVKKPEILILDDSSSALDFATDAKLRKSLRELDFNTTVFVVSQRISSIAHADKIIVLDDGNCVGVGTHDELLNSSEVYKEIYNSQTGGGNQ